MEFIQNVRSRSTEEGADIQVITKGDALGFSTAAGKQWGLTTGSDAIEANPAKGIAAVPAVMPSKILAATASAGDKAINEDGETIDLTGKLILFVSDGKMSYVNGSTRSDFKMFQLSKALKGSPVTIIEQLVKTFDIGSGNYKSILKDTKGLAIKRDGVTKNLEDCGIEDVNYEVKTEVNDFTLTIVDKLVEFQLADGGTISGGFGLLVELHEQTAPKDDRVVKVEHARKVKARTAASPVNVPTVAQVQAGLAMEVDGEEEEEEEEAEA